MAYHFATVFGSGSTVFYIGHATGRYIVKEAIQNLRVVFLVSFNTNHSMHSNPKRMGRYAPKNSTVQFDFAMARVVNEFIKPWLESQGH